MAISVRHPIKAKIDDSYHFIKDLLSEHLAFLNKWELSTRKEFESYAKAEEDPEIRYTISSQYSTVFDDADYRKNLLLQAILIISYSYFESCLDLILKDLGNSISRDKIQTIYRQRGIVMSEEETTAIEFMEEIRELRNDICHNNEGTYRRPELLKKLSKEWDGVNFDGMLTISKPDIVLEVLDKSYFLLSHTCEILDYKTTKIK